MAENGTPAEGAPDDGKKNAEGAQGAEGKESESKAPERKEPEEKEQMVPYSRFKEIIEEKNSAKAKLEKFENEKSEAEKQKLIDEGKTTELLEAERTENKKLKAEKEQTTTENLRLRVGAEKGLPPELITRLTGTTEEEVTKDAEALMAFIPSKAPNLNGKQGDGLPGSGLNDDQKRVSSALGIVSDDYVKGVKAEPPPSDPAKAFKW